MSANCGVLAFQKVSRSEALRFTSRKLRVFAVWWPGALMISSWHEHLPSLISRGKDRKVRSTEFWGTPGVGAESPLAPHNPYAKTARNNPRSVFEEAASAHSILTELLASRTLISRSISLPH
jgi:hypothetical protein